VEPAGVLFDVGYCLMDETPRLEHALAWLAEALAPSDRGPSPAELREAYDYILVDGGAIEHNPAAAVLAARLDSTLLVVEAERSNIPAVRVAADELRSAGANLLGAVLNRRRDYVPAFVAKRLS